MNALDDVIREATEDIAGTTRSMEKVQAALDALEGLDTAGSYTGMACSNLRQARSRLWVAHQEAIKELQSAQREQTAEHFGRTA